MNEKNRHMDLIVNGPAVALSSRGVRRYLEGVMHHLRWPGQVEFLRLGPYRSLERPRELLRRGRKDAILWTPCQRGPIWAHNHVVTVHDCINVEYVHVHDWRLPAFRRLFNSVLNGATRIVAISQATKDAILRNYTVDESRITIIRSGEDAFLADTVDSESAGINSNPGAADTSSPPFVLMVTNSLPHKNALAACVAFADSRLAAAGWSLRVIGSIPPEATTACQRRSARVEVHATVDDALLAKWYRTCQFLLSPSLAEGHNLPIAEALALKARVLCSNIAAHREFYSGRVLFFDPCRQEAIVDALNTAMERPQDWPRSAAPLSANRSFADVARDYEAVFASVAKKATQPSGAAI